MRLSNSEQSYPPSANEAYKRSYPANRLRIAPFLILAALAAACGGSGSGGSTPPPPSSQGSATTTVSDPAPCTNQYSHVYVTVSDVTAHISASGSDTGVDLTPGLSAHPIQVDLMSQQTTECTLATLGSDVGLSAGKYQMITLELLENAPPSGITPPAVNGCSSAGANVFNCVVPVGGTAVALTTPSGTIKLPPGQLAQGGLSVPAGQGVDIDIDFNACASVVQRGHSGQYNLKPTLRASELGTNPLIAGTIELGQAQGSTVALVTPTTPVAGAAVWLEQQSHTVAVGGSSTTVTAENFIQNTRSDSNGQFSFCPVGPGTYELATDAQAMPGGANPSMATITTGIQVQSSGGPNALVIPLVPAPTATPAQVAGTFTTANTAGTAGDDITFAGTQVYQNGTSSLYAMVPFYTVGNGSSQVPTATLGAIDTSASPGTDCPSTNTCPAGTNCACYSFQVPPAPPIVGAAGSSGSGYVYPTASLSKPQGAVDAQALSQTTGSPVCSPTELMTALFGWASGADPAPLLSFTACD